MKCMPTTRSGRDVTAASLVIGIELVLEASTAPSPAASSSSLEDPQLELDVLGGGLDQRGRPSTGSAAVRIRPTRRVGVGLLDLALLDQLGQRALRSPFAPARAAPATRRPGSPRSRRPRRPARCPAPICPAPTTQIRSRHGAGTSSTMASPWAAPEQIAPTPIPPPRRRSWWISVPIRRAPEAPIGCPQRDRAALDVDLLGVGVEQRDRVQHDRAERLVDLEQVDVGRRLSPARSSACRALPGGRAHQVGVVVGDVAVARGSGRAA